MSDPSPAIVTQAAVRRLPRWALWLLCLAYVVPGYVGRDPWKNADIASFGVMLELQDQSGWLAWLHPTLMGMKMPTAEWLPYWLGAGALKLAPPWLPPELAVRIPFMLMLAGVLAATWQAVRDLARHPSAQPVAFAFGGEARPDDYARALADGALLALIATLGLAQFSHETTPALAQLFFVALSFCGFAALPFRPLWASIAIVVGLPGLTFSGAPWTALAYGVIVSLSLLRPGITHLSVNARWRSALIIAMTAAGCAALARWAGVLQWPDVAPPSQWDEWQSLTKLLLWFTWPVWPFVLWALWRWRSQLLHLSHHRHLGLPIAIAVVPIVATVCLGGDNRMLLLALPALAALAAFALPTFRRSMAALIDWFTVLFFSLCAVLIWVFWTSVQFGIPAKPATRVARAAPGFEAVFQWQTLIPALLATLAWLALARWRTGRHRAALWKSLVLPAAGTTLCWVLLMTLWLPAANYARSYRPQMDAIERIIGQPACVQVHGLSPAQVAALRFFGHWNTLPLKSVASCQWLLANPNANASLSAATAMKQWRLVNEVVRPTTKDDTLRIYRRVGAH